MEMVEQEGDYVIICFEVHNNSPDRGRLEVVSRLPREAWMWIEMLEELSDLEGIWRKPEIQTIDGSVYVPVNPNGQTYLREVVFPLLSTFRLIIQLPCSLRGRVFEVGVRLLVGWEELSSARWSIPSVKRATTSQRRLLLQ